MKTWMVSLAALLLSFHATANTLFIDNQTRNRLDFNYNFACENGEVKKGKEFIGARQDAKVDLKGCNIEPNPDSMITIDSCNVQLLKNAEDMPCTNISVRYKFMKHWVEVLIKDNENTP